MKLLSVCLLIFISPLIMKAQPPVPSETTGMTNATINEKGELKIVPATKSSEKDFDFFYGSWKVSGKKLKSRLHHSNEWIPFAAKLNCSQLIGGYANIEPFYTQANGKDFQAFTLRLFDSATKLWSIYYAYPANVTMQNPQVGSFQNNIGWFYARDVWEGKDIIIVYRWDRTDPDKPTMCQAFSADNGKTWEWNYLQSFEKTKE
ncbi:MAG TPA: hypothetical protein VFI33_08690 [Puia sp.]|nr:hypothetical protein [Puia sp.]